MKLVAINVRDAKGSYRFKRKVMELVEKDLFDNLGGKLRSIQILPIWRSIFDALTADYPDEQLPR